LTEQSDPQVNGNLADQSNGKAPRLRVEGLCVCLTGTEVDVVDEVSFEVVAGEILGLVGESGSGKTTVGLALLGFARKGLDIASGRVLLDGADVLTLNLEQLEEMRGSRVSYVPQDPASALNPALKIGAQIKEVLEVHPDAAGQAEDRISQVLTEVDLPTGADFLQRYPHQLSGGQQQRVALAMAFACRPSLIVLDEPTTGLDVSTQRHVLDTVRNLCATHGVAGVYVSHDLAVVGGLVSDVAVLYAGRIVEMGKSKLVFGAPAHPYTRALLAAIPEPDRSETLEGIPGQPPRPGRRPTGCFFQQRCEFRIPACSEPVPLSEVSNRLVRCIRADDVLASGREHGSTLASTAGKEDGLLTVRNLTAFYRDDQALSDVNLALEDKTCTAVVGESGSGKTTLARCIAGLHQDYSGSVRLGDAELAPGTRDRPKETLRRIQLVFQNPYTSLNPRKTIGQLVGQPLEHFFDLGRSEINKRTADALEAVSLSSEMQRRYPDELSGGERQRVAIARALVVEPEILICDEVTSALDVSVQAVIVELLRGLQNERGLSMLFITHNLALVRSIAQFAVVLADGKVVEQGPVEEVLDRPQNPYTIGLMDDVPSLEEAIKA
jgi:peptide/nickel transport system ATP-binding protein